MIDALNRPLIGTVYGCQGSSHLVPSIKCPKVAAWFHPPMPQLPTAPVAPWEELTGRRGRPVCPGLGVGWFHFLWSILKYEKALSGQSPFGHFPFSKQSVEVHPISVSIVASNK